MSHFSEALRVLRKQQGLTQQELADLLQVSKSRINMYENEKREPDFKMLYAFGDFFNVDMNCLLGSPKKSNNIRKIHLDAAHEIEGASVEDKISDNTFFDD